MGLADKNGPIGDAAIVRFHDGPNKGVILAWPENKLPKRIFLCEVDPEVYGIEKECAGTAQRKRWGYYEPICFKLLSDRDHSYDAWWSGWHTTWELIDDGIN